jgi:hypothetical protein
MVAAAIADYPKRIKASIDQIPLGSLAHPDELASVVLCLASPSSAFMIGRLSSQRGLPVP